MLPSSFSASSLKVADGCLSRYHAEYILRGEQEGGSAALVGSICHLTLEDLLRGVFITKTLQWNPSSLKAVFEKAYTVLAGANTDTPEYIDAWDLVQRWFNRPNRYDDLAAVRILSLEAKNEFNVPGYRCDARGNRAKDKEYFPVRYIMDRVERTAEGEFRIVDYKTNRIPLTHDELHDNIQARIYALAIAILYKKEKPERVRVMFDFLRDEPVEIVFTRHEIMQTWDMLVAAVQRILDTPDDKAAKLETINGECIFCVKKTTCSALASNIKAGGIHGLSVDEAGRRLVLALQQKRALAAVEDELKDYLMKQLLLHQTIDLMTEEGTRVRMKRSSRRSADPRLVAKVLGDQLAAEVGSFTIGALEELIKSGRLSQDQINALNEIMVVKLGDPTVDVSIRKTP